MSTWKILLVEDNEEDYLLTSLMLSEAKGSQFVLIWVPTYERAVQAIDCNEVDAILVDYSLGLQNGLDLGRELMARGCKAPIILLTGRGSYEVDVEAMKVGIADYINKDEATPRLLERTIRFAIERRQTEEQLRRANQDLAVAKEELENRVKERTQELELANAQLADMNNILRGEINERKRIEAELAEIQRRLIDSREAERLNLAQELHDGPMQDLYGLAYQVGLLKGESPGENGDLVDTFQKKLQQVIQALRIIAGELRPPSLVPFGLEKAIRSHLENFEPAKANLKIHLHLMPDGERLSERIRLALFRIYQIALMNVVRHARANQVEIRLILEPELVVLEIQDDGRGFQVPSRWIDLARQGHLGLVGASERAEAVGGELKIDSRPGQGTKVRVSVPYSQAAAILSEPMPGQERPDTG
jgi:signal transduction histidine kinase